jgi:poly(hydroxyalkanoate) depolymerase family esterase
VMNSIGKRISRFFHKAKPAQAPAAGKGEWVSGSAGSTSGSRKYMLWVPGTYDPQVVSPLVLMLHGCRQKPEELAEISGMNAVAERNNFLVVYPEQPIRANLLRCWNWFERKHQSRGAGEPSILAAIIEDVRSSHNVEPGRVYVVGISAGAAMAVLLGATYPDLISGIGAVAGLEFKAATGLSSGLNAMKHGGPDPGTQGALAFAAMSAGLERRSRGRMPVIVFHGDADAYVNPHNADQVIMQWAKTNALLDGSKNRTSDLVAVGDFTEGGVPGGHNFQKYAYKDGLGRLLMEKWMVVDMGHAWPGSPVSGKYADPKGPNASQEIWRFFCEARVAPEHEAGKRSIWDRFVGLFR